MARKHHLSDLLGAKLPDGNSEASTTGMEAPPPAFSSRGAIGAVSRSISALRSQALMDIDPDLIDEPKVVDRLEEDPAQFEEFARQIREHGQQVPILVRPHPDVDGRYQIAYGRRRRRACKAAGVPVKAAVRPLTDEELVRAQGQENTGRRDLSFIERALYAAELEANGYGRDTIMAALGVDKTGLSKLISSAQSIPSDIIRAIGPAPKAGRDRWLKLAERLQSNGALESVRSEVGDDQVKVLASDDRFLRVFNLLAPRKQSKGRPSVWKAEDGTRPLRYAEDDKTFTLVLNKKVAPDFGEFLLRSMPEIYADFKKSKD
ncbi:plasmid partitioning protein RepB [Agrobacterium tumefaciens]|uniref:plasmid partitioning protein RepB n=1 Tax=Agrobacterium tumefaciens TaxID=358 RepID=UPI001572215B|nr:plasmid partitioning protein RepB [Agrobacterium tumefaciens]MCZ7497280.1 plasmid partitioning protein RepB [Rhizobium rhizogenes]NTE56496.1 plasmid partitioning protein RepB [Agrobacterium tumefaciens]NTE74464.1 plasmid partitioning protein RepB [Agrobacterium tumefaciens]